jgi:hypothetical protein
LQVRQKVDGVKVFYRFEWRQRACQSCPLRDNCVPPGQKRRSLIVGEHHEFLQQRRQEQGSEAFQQRMHRRNAIEGTLSELAREHGMRRSRYRGFGKIELQNLLIGTACNVKRWLRILARKAEAAQTHAFGLNFNVQSLRQCVLRVLVQSFWQNVSRWRALPLLFSAIKVATLPIRHPWSLLLPTERFSVLHQNSRNYQLSVYTRFKTRTPGGNANDGSTTHIERNDWPDFHLYLGIAYLYRLEQG